MERLESCTSSNMLRALPPLPKAGTDESQQNIVHIFGEAVTQYFQDEIRQTF